MFAQGLLATISPWLGRFGLSCISSDSTFGVTWVDNSCLTFPTSECQRRSKSHHRSPVPTCSRESTTNLPQGQHFAGSPSSTRREVMTASLTSQVFPFPAAWKALRCLFFSNTTQKLLCWECCWCGHQHRTAGMGRNWLDGDFPCHLTSFPLFPWLFIVEDSFAAGEGESFSCLLLKSTLATF